MPTSTVTSKGQITIPVAVRLDLHLKPGSKVGFVKIAEGVYQLIPETASIRDLKGIVQWSGGPVTVEEMREAIAAEAVESARP
jgi:antitoxin PrlF